MLYDGLLVVALLMLAAALVVIPTGMLFLPEGSQFAASDPWFRLYLLVAWWAYFAICWRNGGQTVGMKAWRIRVVDDQERRIGWAATVKRFLLAFVSGAAAGLGFLWSLFDRERRAWHDIGSGTRLQVEPKPDRGG